MCVLVFEREKYTPILCPLQVDVSDKGWGWAYMHGLTIHRAASMVFRTHVFCSCCLMPPPIPTNL